MRTIVLFAVLALGNALAYGQSIKVESFEAQIAKSAIVETLSDSVAVILKDPQPGTKTGAYLNVTSDRTWATPVLDGIEFTETQTKGRWLVFAPAGSYRVLLIESHIDQTNGPRYTWHNLVIDKPKLPPTVVDPPVVVIPGDYTALIAVVKAGADKLNDPPTRLALAAAYKTALNASVGKTYDVARFAVRTERQRALNLREGASQLADWDSWRLAVDAELGKAVPAGDVGKYLGAIDAIVKGLQ